MRKLLPLLLALILPLAACGDSTGPGATTGTIEGTIILSPGININLNNARAAIYTSVADLDNDRFVKQAAVTGSGSRYTFEIRDIPPGVYYLDVCVLQGCVEFSRDGNQPSPISIVAGTVQPVELRI